MRVAAACLFLIASALEAQGIVTVRRAAGGGASCTIPGSPEARWRLEDGSASSPVDETANSNDWSGTAGTQDSGNVIEGSFSRDFSGSENLSITDANLSNDVPGDASSAETGITVVCWVRPHTLDTSFRRVIVMDDWSISIDSSDQWEWFLRTSSGVSVAASDGGTAVDDPVANTFHCVAGSWADDGDDQMRLCVDSGSGVACKNGGSTLTGTVDTGSNGIAMASNVFGSQQFDGELDHCVIDNIQWTDSEIQDFCDCTDGS